jgi:F420-0:gamma-glutamyl ligase-like protein
MFAEMIARRVALLHALRTNPYRASGVCVRCGAHSPALSDNACPKHAERRARRLQREIARLYVAADRVAHVEALCGDIPAQRS